MKGIIPLVNRVPPDEKRCTAKSKQRQARCQQPAMPYQRVCYWHGGRSPNALKGAREREALDKARQFLAQNGYGQVEDPLEAMQDLASEIVATKDFFRQQIDTLRYQDRMGEQVRAEVTLYERALDRSMKVLKLLSDMGISERRTSLAESQAVMLQGAVTRILDALELTPKQRAIAGTVVPDELRALTMAPDAAAVSS